MPTEHPTDLLFHPEHDWARVDGPDAVFGITDFAQEQLGELVYWDPPALGTRVEAGAAYTELESVKAVSDVVAPLSGEIVAVNEPAAEAPDLINTSPYDAGWLVRVRLADVGEAEQLLGAAAYAALLDESV
jgi:glycine cleavage system H protein